MPHHVHHGPHKQEVTQGGRDRPRTYACRWCGTVSSGADLSCPACGAPVDIKAITSQDGWTALPKIRDMVSITFSQSSCQIEGSFVPVADVHLKEEDWVYFPYHMLLWKDEQVGLNAIQVPGYGSLSRLLIQTEGTGHIALSRDMPGDILALPLKEDTAIDVPEDLFVMASHNVDYEMVDPQIWFTTAGNVKQQPLGPFMDRFYTNGKAGLLLLHAAGDAFERNLAQGESILIKPASLVFMEATLHMQIYIEVPKGVYNLWQPNSQRYIWLKLTGPGRLAIQSADKSSEDNGARITSTSPGQMQEW